MKTSLKVLSLFTAALLPGSVAAEFAGVPVPTGLDPTSAFVAFVVTLVALTAFADYSRVAQPLPVSPPDSRGRTSAGGVGEKSAHPLAA